MKKFLFCLSFFFCVFTHVNGQNKNIVANAKVIENDVLDDAVVLIKCYDIEKNFIGHGSGFLISATGDVVTNYHVIEDVYKLIIKLENGKNYEVDKIVGISKEKDLAILKLNNPNKDVFPYCTISKIKPKKGTQAIAIGSPADTLFMNTISSGLISNIDSSRDFLRLQTTAPIAHGSSGGALFNENKEVVGITYAGYGSADGSRANINFAIWIGELSKIKSVNKTRIYDPKLDVIETIFYVTNLRSENDISLYVDGKYIGDFNKYFPKESPNCSNDGILSVSLQEGSHDYVAYEKSTNRYWKKRFSVTKGNECAKITISIEPYIDRIYTADSLPIASAKRFFIKVKMPGFNHGFAYLCYHMGKNLNIVDSSVVRNDGVVIFKGNERLIGGIYSIVFPGKRLTADFFVDRSQDISIYADTTDLLSMKVTGSPDYPMFQRYQKFVMAKSAEMQKERNAYNVAANRADSSLHEGNFAKLNKEVSAYRDSIVNNYPESLLTLFLNTMKEPEILNKNPKTRQDSLDNYNHYRAHYWDGITFMDDRIIRTPFFLPKLERYFRELLPQAPDTIIKELDYKLLLARTAPEMYKFLLNWFTDEYLNPKYMGQDAVFVHLFEKYHSKGVSSWLNEKQMETISKRAYMQMSNLIGAKAANLEMVDSTGKKKALYDQEAEYMLLAFWDPTCGHCKEEVPRIDSIYRASWKKHGVKIYSVLSDNEKKKEWVNFIKEKNIGDWINVYETPEMEKKISEAKVAGFRQLFDVIQTPTLLLLDKDKRIIGKKLGWEQLNELLETKWNKEKKETK